MASRLLLGVVVVACSRSNKTKVSPHDPCAADQSNDAEVGVHNHGAANVFDFALVSLDPKPPARGDNAWVVQLSAIPSGAPLSDAQLTVTPFMPDHGHGTPIKVNVVTMPVAGQYQLAPINSWMPGHWETTIHATRGALSDSAVFKFCIAN